MNLTSELMRVSLMLPRDENRGGVEKMLSRFQTPKPERMAIAARATGLVFAESGRIRQHQTPVAANGCDPKREVPGQ